MLGATALTLYKIKMTFTTIDIMSLILGFVISFLAAILVVDKFVNFLKKKCMVVFAIYRIFVGLVLLSLVFTKILK